MSDDFYVEKSQSQSQPQSQAPAQNQSQSNQGKVIDEANYRIHAPKERGPAAVGRGGDPFFMSIRATKEQLAELLDQTTTIQDWVQRETCNNVALTCLDNENLKEVYYEIKDGFGNYGPIMLMGYKTPSGVEIPRLKILDTNGEVLEVLTGPLAIDELNKRAIAYRESLQDYNPAEMESVGVIQDYSGNPDDYI